MSYDAYIPGVDDDTDPEMESLRAQAAHDRRAHHRLMANPDCRDPDHPGCKACEESEA